MLSTVNKHSLRPPGTCSQKSADPRSSHKPARTSPKIVWALLHPLAPTSPRGGQTPAPGPLQPCSLPTRQIGTSPSTPAPPKSRPKPALRSLRVLSQLPWDPAPLSYPVGQLVLAHLGYPRTCASHIRNWLQLPGGQDYIYQPQRCNHSPKNPL